ncbi:hypothetical protein CERSUDRAFT_110863 [Gelatoporia subvermispora B]|uniref:C2H2-type domain-containing protein n=1 Tax=Ceriporiopsis subvermispora (strain B) TaxID=914234 RepID=M2PZJ4_CERS8|nr:hypothetical protein CERSUDRAFT_110863 [Gelatoporia subvermispora B]
MGITDEWSEYYSPGGKGWLTGLRDVKTPQEQLEQIMNTPTWDGTPVMPESWKPVSFIVRRSFAKPIESATNATIEGGAQIEPRSLPLPQYGPPGPERRLQIRRRLAFAFVDGKKHDIHNDHLIPSCWLPRPGPQKSCIEEILPVAGVNKKGKGRQVPTREMGVRKGRTYTCRVLQCRKVFTRYEHLRRHTVSIHSHEKPHVCPLPFCDKAFSRLDNLRQHMKVHKDCGTIYDCTRDFDGVEFGKFEEINLDIPKPIDEPHIPCFDPQWILFLKPELAETGDSLGLITPRRPRRSQVPIPGVDDQAGPSGALYIMDRALEDTPEPDSIDTEPAGHEPLPLIVTPETLHRHNPAT